MQDKQFAKRLVQAMEQSGFTQRTLAKSVGVSQSTISRLLKGTLPALAVGVHLSTILNVNHRWLVEGIAPPPEIEFNDGMRRRLFQVMHLEGMKADDLARIAVLPVETFSAVERGQNPAANLLGVWMTILNVEERYILEGRGRIFKDESRFVLIAPGEVEKRKEELAKLKEEAEFLGCRINRLQWELSESQKAHRAEPYHPRILSSVRKRT